MADYSFDTVDLENGAADGGVVDPVTSPAAPPAVAGTPKAPPGTVPAGTEVAAPADKSISLREQLTKAFKGEKAPDPAADPAAPVTDAQGRVRNADGTFAPAPAVDASSAAPAAAAAPAVQAIQPPAMMSPGEAQLFTSLPPEMQQFVARTMQGVEQAASQFQGYAHIEPMLAQRRQAWAMNGMSEGQALNQLLATSDFATQRPAEFLAWFAQSQGIDLAELADGLPPVDPEVQQLKQTVQQLQGHLSQFTSGQQQAAHSAVVNEIAQFAEEKGADGQPVRPYFQQLAADIMPLIQAVRSQNPGMSNRDVLAQAYDRACWANPQVRGNMTAASEAQRLSEQRAATARAQNAGGSVNGAPVDASTVTNTADRTLRDELRANFAKYT